MMREGWNLLSPLNLQHRDRWRTRLTFREASLGRKAATPGESDILDDSRFIEIQLQADLETQAGSQDVTPLAKKTPKRKSHDPIESERRRAKKARKLEEQEKKRLVEGLYELSEVNEFQPRGTWS